MRTSWWWTRRPHDASSRPVPPAVLAPGAAAPALGHRQPATSQVASPHRRGDTPSVGVRNYLVEGVSGTGKTSVCRELRRRGYDAVNGDTDLAYQGDPMTGRPTDTSGHEHHLWDVRRVRELAADRGAPVTFFCGGSRNFADFIDLFDDVFVLEVDLDTLLGRLDRRVGEEWGARPSERDLVLRLHRTKEDVPGAAAVIDATRPLSEVVDEVLRRAGVTSGDPRRPRG